MLRAGDSLPASSGGRAGEIVRFQHHRYGGRPDERDQNFQRKEVDELIVPLDIDARRERKPHRLGRPAPHGGGILCRCYGGGVRSVKDASRAGGVGVEKVALNSAALRPTSCPPWPIGWAARVVAAIDVKKPGGGERVFDHVTAGHAFSAVEHAQRLVERGQVLPVHGPRRHRAGMTWILSGGFRGWACR